MQVNMMNGAGAVQSPLSFVMSPEEKIRTEAEVDMINKQTFAGSRMPKRSLGQDEFLELLVAQFKYQDPTAPMKDAEFIGQMAQFSSLEQMNSMNSNFSRLNDMLRGSTAAGAVGYKVDLNSGTETVSGHITAATCGASPEVMVNGKWYSWSSVKTIYAN